MQIVADEQIPYLRNFFGPENKIISLPAEKITAATIQDADVLLVRSVTKINRQLLSDSSVRFIGSATAGIDHIDTQLLNEEKIAWAYSPGCNAKAVSDYVLISVAHLQEEGLLKKNNVRAGVIGAGYVGQQVVQILERLNFEIVVSDPPRAEVERNFISTPLEDFYELDLICLHTPLTITGSHPTHHLLNEHFFKNANSNCVIINAGRGACINSDALKKSLTHSSLTAVLDVWEHEPNIDADLAQAAFIATPHIAGYSEAAKYRATKQLFDAFCDHFEIDHYVNPEEDTSHYVELDLTRADWAKRAIEIENLKLFSNKFKEALKKDTTKTGNIFQHFRNNYSYRREFI